MRDSAVTYTKAIGIILMVIGHSNCPSELWNFIYMFHMPLFFIMAGYCFKEKYPHTPIDYVKKKVKGIYWPFLKWSLLMLVLHNIFCTLYIYDSSYGYMGSGVNSYSLQQYGRSLIKNVCLMDTTEPLLGGFWFLRTLFLCSILSYILLTLKNTATLNVLKMGGAILTAIVLKISNFHISSIGIDSLTMMSISLFIAGYLIKQIGLRTLKWHETIIIICVTIVGSLFWRGQLLDCKALNIIPYIATSIVATWGIYSMFRCVSKPLPILSYIGNNTLIILALHFLSFKVVSLLLIFANALPLDYLGYYPTIESFSAKGWWIAYSFVGLFIPVLIKYTYDKFKYKNDIK